MDLRKQLDMFANQSASTEESDKDLSGVSINKTKEEIDENDEDLDFSSNPLSIDSYLMSSGYKKNKKKDKKKKPSEKFSDFFDEIPTKKKDPVDELLSTSDDLMEAIDFEKITSFDSFLNGETGDFSEEDNSELKNSLISLGRKYARDNAASKESSEIVKTFADSEKRLKELYGEVANDKEDIQKEINKMKVPGRGGKTLADLISAKNAAHNTQLAIVKEINSMRKGIFDMRTKEAARKSEENNSNDINANTLQSLFSAKGDLVGAMGGYGNVSGANDYDNEDNTPLSNLVANDGMSDEEIEKKYFSEDSKFAQTKDDTGMYIEGDYLEYENRNVSLVAVFDNEDNIVDVYAEDEDGIKIPGYPLIPDNWQELDFDIDSSGESATDSYHRVYKMRRE